MLAEAADLSFNGNDSDEEMVRSTIDKPPLGLVTEDIGGKLLDTYIGIKHDFPR